jgi:Zn-dependent protease with chaperone function
MQRGLRQRVFEPVCAIVALGAALLANGAYAQSDIRPREVTKLSLHASVVLDRNCPQIVQPFTLADNAASLAMFSAKEALSDVGTAFLSDPAGFLSGKRKLAVPSTDKLSASTRLAAKQLNWLPMTAEVAYGQRQHDEETDVLERDSRLGRQHYPNADRMLQEILAAVGEPHDYRFQLFILKSSSRNAVARPGGFLYVDQGLIDDPNRWPKAYFAIAHELAHVLQRHETRELQSNAIDAVESKSDVLNLVTNARVDPNLLLNYVKVQKGRFTKYHVDQELQADSCAVRLLSRTLDRQALTVSVDVFVADLPQMQAEPASQPQPPGRRSSLADAGRAAQSVQEIVDSPVKRHPTNQERARNLREIQAEIRADARGR